MQNSLAHLDYFREELIGGEMVAMSPANPRHNRIAAKIYHVFQSYLTGKTCIPFADGTEVRLTDKDRFIPDGMVICDRSKIKANWVEGPPDLVWEVLSPRTARNDRWHKKNVYEASGVPEYWLADQVNKSIEVYLLQDGRYVLDNVYTFYTAEDLANLPEEDRDGLLMEFKCHLYDDLVIRLEDIFGDLF